MVMCYIAHCYDIHSFLSTNSKVEFLLPNSPSNLRSSAISSPCMLPSTWWVACRAPDCLISLTMYCLTSRGSAPGALCFRIPISSARVLARCNVYIMGSEILPSSRSSAKPFCLAYCEETGCQQIYVYTLAYLDGVVLVVRL